MAYVYIDRIGAHDAVRVQVSWFAGAAPKKSKTFDCRGEAEQFAIRKMGRSGCILSTLDMTPEQLADHRAREARAAALLAGVH